MAALRDLSTLSMLYVLKEMLERPENKAVWENFPLLSSYRTHLHDVYLALFCPAPQNHPPKALFWPKPPNNLPQGFSFAGAVRTLEYLYSNLVFAR